MGLAIHKTLAFISLIVLGFLLKRKITNKEQISGIKAVILSVALPATIFIALLKIDIKPTLIFLPIIALFVNVVMLGAARLVLPFFHFSKGTPEFRTLALLLASFAPGLSCFPFLAEYWGEESLAHAALADVGNKAFVLIFLYLLAMHWYYQLLKKRNVEEEAQSNSRLKSLLLSLGREPVNMVMLIAILLLCFGQNLAALPAFMQDAITRMSALMTPLVLMFIGLAVKIKRSEMIKILQLLMARSGFAFILSALMLALVPTAVPIGLLVVAVAFPQSACSFWPFAHMTAVEELEKNKPQRTFNLDLALNILAFSLPYSTVMVLVICSFGNFFSNPFYLIIVGMSLVGFSVLSFTFGKARKRRQKGIPSQQEIIPISVKEAIT